MSIFNHNDNEHWPAPNLTPEEQAVAQRESEEYLKTVKEAFTYVDGDHVIEVTKMSPLELFAKIVAIDN
jgi:hypothetical protein